jgi:anti-anti-sigma factor
MQWEEHAFGGVMVLSVIEPRLDVDSGDGLKRAVADIVSRRHRRLVIDLSAVRFMDSVGLNCLIGCFKNTWVRAAGSCFVGFVPLSARCSSSPAWMKVFKSFAAVADAVDAIAPKET